MHLSARPWSQMSALRARSHSFLWKMTAVESAAVTQTKLWIQRIVIGTIGVEMATTLVDVLKGSLPS